MTDKKETPNLRLIDRVACCPHCDEPLIIHLTVIRMSKEGFRMRKRPHMLFKMWGRVRRASLVSLPIQKSRKGKTTPTPPALPLINR